MDIWLLLYALTFLFAIPRIKWHRKQNRKVIIIPDPTVNLSPNANGDLQQFPSQYPTTGYHYDKVDDPPATPDDASTYIYGSINNSSITDIYQLQDFTPAGAYINQIKVFIRVKSNKAGTEFYAVIKTGGTIYESANLGDALNAWTTYSNIWASNPQTGNPWTPAEINALQAGVRAWCATGSTVQCTMVYVEVTYVIPPAAPTNCSVAILSETSLRVSWTDASTDEDDFHVERKTGAGGTYAEVQVVTSTTKATTGTVYTWDNTGLSLYCSDTYNYYYRVRAHRHSDNVYSNYSNEAANVSCFQSLQDSGVGVDTPYLEGQVPVQDVGVGEDIATVAIGVEYKDVFDSGSGVDTPTVESQIPAADSGVGVDTPFIETQIPVTDLGLGTDIIQSIEVPVQDSGLGVDEVTSIEIPVSDSGLGTDVPSIETSIPVSDSGIGVDTPTIEGQVSVLDSGIGVDTIPSIGILVSDAGLGVDVPSIQSQVQVTDLGSGVEVVSVEGQIVVVDLGVGVDTPSLLGQIPVSDLGVGVDVAKSETLQTIQDSGVGVDSIFIVRKPPSRLLTPVRILPPDRIIPPVR